MNPAKQSTSSNGTPKQPVSPGGWWSRTIGGVGGVWLRPSFREGLLIGAAFLGLILLLQPVDFFEPSLSQPASVYLGLALLVLILAGLGLSYIGRFYRELWQRENLFYLLLLLALTTVGLIKLFNLVGWGYAAPVGLAAILISILFNPQIALAVATVLSLLGGVIAEFDLALTIYYFVGGVVAVLSLGSFQRQRDLVRCGWILMVVNTAMAVVLELLFAKGFEYRVLLLAATSGLLAAVLALGLLPFIEHLFKVTSPIRLLELANPGNHLLRRLQLEAPGTYHHSIMVGNLAEAAATAIGADGLLVRVGAYYHDLGKLKRPEFFAENQFAQKNPHRGLKPSLSTLIIICHVKEGVELAQEQGLPEKLVDLIEQHHGTDLVRYFYKQATAAVTDANETPIEQDFRYEGPKPQTKEAALVMLADAVEAAVKSLPKPTQAKLELLVEQIIQERLDDGQLDLCDLTFKDLGKIKSSFLKVLGGLFHSRIQYPQQLLAEITRGSGHAGRNK